MFNYAIRFETNAAGAVTGFCRDIDGFEVSAATRQDVIVLASTEMSNVLAKLAANRRTIPMASSPMEGEQIIPLSAVVVAKIALWNEMLKREMRKSDLYNLLSVAPAQVDRLLDFHYQSKIHSLEEALSALGVEIRGAAPDQQWINLAQGGFFAKRLVDAYVAAGVTEMPIGKNREGLASVKTYSLDYILRTRYARQPDTMQAVDSVLESLVASGLFRRSRMIDPKTNHEVDSIALA